MGPPSGPGPFRVTDVVFDHWKSYAIFWALLRSDDLVGGVHFTIRTDHCNLLFMNNHGLRKVLQWKLDIQQYDAIIEHVAGKANIPTDVFSRLIVPVQLHHVLILQCTLTQRTLIERFHTYLHAHCGAEKRLNLWRNTNLLKRMAQICLTYGPTSDYSINQQLKY